MDDYLVFAGALGLLTGMGGRYFFIIPVADTPPGQWGSEAFSLEVPGAWTTGPNPQGGLLSVNGLESAATILFNLDPTVFNLPANDPQWSPWTPGQTWWSTGQTPGPLGKMGGYLFAGLLAAGLALKIKNK